MVLLLPRFCVLFRQSLLVLHSGLAFFHTHLFRLQNLLYIFLVLCDFCHHLGTVWRWTSKATPFCMPLHTSLCNPSRPLQEITASQHEELWSPFPVDISTGCFCTLAWIPLCNMWQTDSKGQREEQWVGCERCHLEMSKIHKVSYFLFWCLWEWM